MAVQLNILESWIKATGEWFERQILYVLMISGISFQSWEAFAENEFWHNVLNLRDFQDQTEFWIMIIFTQLNRWCLVRILQYLYHTCFFFYLFKIFIICLCNISIDFRVYELAEYVLMLDLNETDFCHLCRW